MELVHYLTRFFTDSSRQKDSCKEHAHVYSAVLIQPEKHTNASTSSPDEAESNFIGPDERLGLFSTRLDAGELQHLTSQLGVLRYRS